MRGVYPERAVSSDTLDSWKEIAAHFHRGVRTVMRWELDRGLPVHRVPGGGKPGVYALRSELDRWWTKTRPHLVEEAEKPVPARRTPSVAVLPLSNLSANKENEYFSDGLADEIITALTRVKGLRVTARTSSFAFRGKEQDVREIGAKLGVSVVLEGSIQRSRGQIRISAQLVDVKDGFHLWSEHYDRKIGDVFAIQDEISHAIADALQVRLAPSRAVRPRVNMEAYNCWLKGRYYQHYESLDALEKCRMCLEQAIALDPQFAQPLVDLAEQIRAAAEFGVLRPLEAFATGQSAIHKAFQIEPSLGEAYALSGAYRAWKDFDWKGASADFDRALELTPGSVHAHRLRATYLLLPTGRLREAEEETELAVESDPLSPLAYIALGKVLLWAHQFDRAHAKMEAAYTLRPDYPLAALFLGVGLYFQDRIEEALEMWQSVVRIIGRAPVLIGAIGLVQGLLGRRAEARTALAELEALGRESYVPRVSVAQIHLGLGEMEAAFESLDRAVEERDPGILDLPCKPIWDEFRSDTRFIALMRKMRLA